MIDLCRTPNDQDQVPAVILDFKIKDRDFRLNSVQGGPRSARLPQHARSRRGGGTRLGGGSNGRSSQRHTKVSYIYEYDNATEKTCPLMPLPKISSRSSM